MNLLLCSERKKIMRRIQKGENPNITYSWCQVTKQVIRYCCFHLHFRFIAILACFEQFTTKRK